MLCHLRWLQGRPRLVTYIPLPPPPPLALLPPRPPFMTMNLAAQGPCDAGGDPEMEGRVDALLREDTAALRALFAELTAHGDGRLKRALEVYALACHLRREVPSYVLFRTHGAMQFKWRGGADLQEKLSRARRLGEEGAPLAADRVSLAAAQQCCKGLLALRDRVPSAALDEWLQAHGDPAAVLRRAGFDGRPYQHPPEAVDETSLGSPYFEGQHLLRDWFAYLDRLGLPALLAPSAEARLHRLEVLLEDDGRGRPTIAPKKRKADDDGGEAHRRRLRGIADGLRRLRAPHADGALFAEFPAFAMEARRRLGRAAAEAARAWAAAEDGAAPPGLAEVQDLGWSLHELLADLEEPVRGDALAAVLSLAARAVDALCD
jgi:hypothetical protein